jgi:uncharacterized protein YajQ (UPF0234 family)
MNSTLTNEINTPEINNTVPAALRELTEVFTLFAVTATIILLTSIVWIA